MSVSKKTIESLMRKPKEKIKPKIQNFKFNSVHQADTVYLPTDKRYTKALVVVDTSTKIADARPMTTSSSKEVLKALKSIYRGKYLKKPNHLETDRGVEFEGEVTKYLKQNNIQHKIARTDRHRQVALAERLNQKVGKDVFVEQNFNEVNKKKTDRSWVKYLPKIIQDYNKGKTKNIDVEKKMNQIPTIKCTGQSCVLLEKGTKVRVAADYPQNPVTGKKLHGKFRKTDLKYETTIRTITRVILQPGQPPMYAISGKGNNQKGKYKNLETENLGAWYTREQLKPVKESEQHKLSSDKPKKETAKKWEVLDVLKKTTDKNGKVFYIIKWKPTIYDTKKKALEEIKKTQTTHPIKTIKENGKTKYKVMWKNSSEPASIISEDLKDLIKKFK